MSDSPIAKAIAARNRPGKRPYPSLDENQRQELRKIAAVPIDYHPGAIRGETAAAQAAGTSLAALHTAWTTIRTAAASDAEMGQVASLGERALGKALATSDKTIALLASREDEINAKIGAAIAPKISDQLATEVRSLVRANGIASLRRAAEQDARVAAAVLDMPPALSGMDQKQHDAFRASMVTAHAGDLAEELKETALARTKLTRAKDRALETLGPKLSGMKQRTPEALDKLKELA